MKKYRIIKRRSRGKIIFVPQKRKWFVFTYWSSFKSKRSNKVRIYSTTKEAERAIQKDHERSKQKKEVRKEKVIGYY
jgi:hypothetical protein